MNRPPARPSTVVLFLLGSVSERLTEDALRAFVKELTPTDWVFSLTPFQVARPRPADLRWRRLQALAKELNFRLGAPIEGLSSPAYDLDSVMQVMAEVDLQPAEYLTVVCDQSDVPEVGWIARCLPYPCQIRSVGPTDWLSWLKAPARIVRAELLRHPGFRSWFGRSQAARRGWQPQPTP